MRIYAYFFKWHKKLPLGIGAQGPMTSSEKTYPSCVVPPKKVQIQNFRNLFKSKLQDFPRLLEGFNSSLP